MIAMSDLFRVSLRQVVRQRGFGVILSIALGITAFIALSVLGQEIRYKVGQDMVLMGCLLYTSGRPIPPIPK